MKLILIRIIVVMLCPIFLVGALTWNSVQKANVHHGFTRTFSGIAVTQMAKIKKDKNIWNVIDVRDGLIYLQGTNPRAIYSTNLSLDKIDTTLLAFRNTPEIASNFEHLIEKDRIWVFAKNIPSLILVEDTTSKTIPFPDNTYSRIVKIGDSSFVYRGFDKNLKTMDQIFWKGNIKDKKYYREKKISEMHNDAGYSTDGLLHYDKSTNSIIYVYFYKNEGLCLDTNLNVRYSFHTVDTFSQSKTLAGGIVNNKKKYFTNVAPSTLINTDNCVDDGVLYNYSLVKADNESKANFMNNAEIDIYSLRDGKYTGSFYIPNYQGQKLLHFKVKGKTVCCMYRDFIVLYSIDR